MTVIIRGLDPELVRRIDNLAEKHHMSRNKYLKKCFSSYAVTQDVADLEQKYMELVQTLLERLAQANDVIEVNNTIIRRLSQGARRDP